MELKQGMLFVVVFLLSITNYYFDMKVDLVVVGVNVEDLQVVSYSAV